MVEQLRMKQRADKIGWNAPSPKYLQQFNVANEVHFVLTLEEFEHKTQQNLIAAVPIVPLLTTSDPLAT